MRRFFGFLFLIALLLGLAYLFLPLLPQLKNAQRYASLLSAPAPVAGSLPNPLTGQRFVDTWGAARSGGRKHEGIDIFAKRNTPIHSTTAGMVINIGENPLGGRTITVLGAGGYRHYYAHLERYPNLKAGQWIERGTTVGYVGDSGNAKGTPTHVHYGIYTPKGAINPFLMLKQSQW